jgi:hypothetical protein
MKRYLLIAIISCVVLPNFCMKNGVESKTQADTKAEQAESRDKITQDYYRYEIDLDNNLLEIFDVSDVSIPEDLSLIRRIKLGITPADFAFHQGYLYIIGQLGLRAQLLIYDVSSPRYTALIGFAATGNRPQTIKIDASDEKKGILAYVTFEDGTSQTFNVTHPAAPFLI